MINRLGDVPEEMFRWWVKLFESTSPRVAREIINYARTMDLSSLLPHINVPTLMIVRQESPTSKRWETIEKWPRIMPRCELLVIPSSGYHLAASKPEECTAALLDFLQRVRKQEPG